LLQARRQLSSVIVKIHCAFSTHTALACGNTETPTVSQMSASLTASVAVFEQNCLKFLSDMISVPANTKKIIQADYQHTCMLHTVAHIERDTTKTITKFLLNKNLRKHTQLLSSGLSFWNYSMFGWVPQRYKSC